jgi:hypothetical protein
MLSDFLDAFQIKYSARISKLGLVPPALLPSTRDFLHPTFLGNTRTTTFHILYFTT